MKNERKIEMKWYLECWKKYATFSGRARRKEYWMFVLFNLIATFVAGFVDGLIGTCVIAGLYALASLLPALAVSVRRLHDTNRSGWWILIGIIPLIGGIWLFVLLVLDGSPESNRFGSNPKIA